MRILIVPITMIAIASAAGAATLTIVPDQPFYLPGETITLTVLGDAEGATAQGLFGRLEWAFTDLGNGTSTQNSAGSPPWILAPLFQGPGFAEAFSQLDSSLAGSTGSFPGDVVSVVTLVMQGPGPVHVSWAPSLSFFGLTSAPGITISTPEPGSAALLGLGLLALAATRRRT